MGRVVVLGSSNTDLTVALPSLPAPGQTVLGGSFRTGHGGKGANQAVAARRAGAEVVFVTAVGDDRFGRQALEHYQDEGIDVSHALILPGEASGVALIFVGEVGENMIGVASGANTRLEPVAIDHLPESLFCRGDILLVGLEIPLETVANAVRRAHGAGMTVILNPAPANPALLELDILRFVDLLTPNLIEACALAGLTPTDVSDVATRAAEVLLANGVSTVIVTLGIRGCLVLDRAAPNGRARTIPAHRVSAVDTVGAGDAFNGALAAALSEGRTVFEAAVWASAAAGLAVTRPGAQEALPDRQAIDRLAAEIRPE